MQILKSYSQLHKPQATSAISIHYASPQIPESNPSQEIARNKEQVDCIDHTSHAVIPTSGIVAACSKLTLLGMNANWLSLAMQYCA